MLRLARFIPVGVVLLTALAGCADIYVPPDFSAVEDLHQPPEYKSDQGVLDVQLDARQGLAYFDGVAVDTKTYNDDYAGPVLRVYPGDAVAIRLINHLDEPTNLHFHGYQGSPLGRGDNMHIVVDPGQSFDYQLKIPATQPPGLYWYHAHIHHKVEEQIMGGLGGTLIVEGLPRQLGLGPEAEERLFVFKDYVFDESDDPVVRGYFHRIIQTLNGQTRSTVTMQAGQTQLWRFANESADNPVTFTLQGHEFRIVAVDGVAVTGAMARDRLVIPPAGRMEALVDAGAPGDYALTSMGVPTGAGDTKKPDRVLAMLRVAEGDHAPLAAVAHAPVYQDLRAKKIDAHRVVVFTERASEGKYFINGQLFDHARLDTRVPLGSVEEWTLKNDSDDYHAFHIHQVAFQVVSINGRAQPFDGFVDTVQIPERGEVKILLPFTDPAIVGQFMYHCHVLMHEDKGMMSTIEVYDPKAPVGQAARHHHEVMTNP